MSKVLNLDEGIEESLEFIANGIHYRMKYLTTEEVQELTQIKDQKKAADFLQTFITNVNEGEDSFEKIYSKLTIPKVKRFFEMLRSTFDIGIPDAELDGTDKS